MNYYYGFATGEDDWRLKRLQKAVRIACAILGISEPQLSSLIVEIADNSGRLHIIWKHKYTPNQELAFRAAWRECGEETVTHSIFGGNHAAN